MKKVIIYIHGFNSGPGDKSLELVKQFPNCEVIAPQLPYDCDEAMGILKQIVNQNLDKEVYIVGTSLGAFYAMLLSTMYESLFNITYYLINPPFTPHATLRQLLNSTVVNYKTGEQFYVTQDFLDKLEGYQRALVKAYSLDALHSSNFFLGTLDELLNFSNLVKFIQQFQAPYRLYYSVQDHRFADLSSVVAKMRDNMVY